jgi:phosphoenolpyruvate---glycerone phosphotransferase subunit DhaL
MSNERFVNMLSGAARQVRANHEILSQLDSCGGDGDHGTTMLRAMDCLEKAAAGSAAKPLAELLRDVAWALMGVDGGATGPLFGSLLMGMADAADGELDGPRVAAMFESGLAGVRKRTKAQLGDKTMIDSLVPAVEAARKAADAGGDANSVLAAAAEGARLGAETTKQFQARFGRAKNVGPKSIGVQDAGATSTALVFQGFAEGYGG